MSAKSKVKSNKKNKSEHLDVAPVFRLKPVWEGRCISKYIGNIKVSEQLVDQPMEMECDGLDYTKVLDKCVYMVGEFGTYEITARACICNISASYLIKNNKLPVYYCTILYEKRFVSGQLFTLFVYFNIDSDTEKELLTPKKYVNKLMNGKFTIELISDESFLSFLIEKKKPEIEEQLMKNYMDQFDFDNEEKNSELMKKIESETTEKLNAYRKLFEPIEIPYPKKSLIVSKFNELLKHELFSDLINKGLEQRENDRREKSCPDQDYKIPKKIINLKELKEHPEKLDELMNNLSDVDSDDE